jgi:hypothetical protein
MGTRSDRPWDARIARHSSPYPANPGLDEHRLFAPRPPFRAITDPYRAVAYHNSREQGAQPLPVVNMIGP